MGSNRKENDGGETMKATRAVKWGMNKLWLVILLLGTLYIIYGLTCDLCGTLPSKLNTISASQKRF